jgi:hypothetical protein
VNVYAVYEDYDSEPRLFATRELAVAHVDPGIRTLWAQAIDPKVDMGHGWGGTQWRVEHYTALGFDAFRERRLELEISELEVVDGTKSVAGRP